MSTAVPKPNRSTEVFGKIVTGIIASTAIGLTVICYPFVSPALRKHVLPFVPATSQQISNVIKCLPRNHAREDKLLDIGSGDGRIVVNVAKKLNLESHGVELNPWLNLIARLRAAQHGVTNKTKFIRQDLWKFPMQRYNYIVIFGVEQMMADLEAKFKRELNGDATVIACRFPLPSCEPIRVIDAGVDSVWVYRPNSNLRIKKN